MRRVRKIGAIATLGALVSAVALTGSAGAATSGVGTSKANTTIVQVDLGQNGSLLNLAVGADDGTANIDPKLGSSLASSSLSPLTSNSSVSALNLTVPKVSVSSTGEPQSKSVPSISLTTPLSTGAVAPLSLAAAVDSTNGAASGLTSTLSNVTVVGGLLSVPTLTSNLGAAARPGDSDGLRGIQVPSIQVLNVGAVLQGLGINPAALTVSQVSGALDQLATTVSTGAGALNGTQLTQLSGLQALLTAPPLSTLLATAPTTPLTDPLVAPVLAAITAAIPGGIPAGVTTVQGLSDLLTGAFTNAVNTLGSAPLLSVSDLTAGLATKATDTVANSSATVEAGIGSMKIGNAAALPGVDLASTAGQVSALVNTAQGQVNDVLNAVGLGDLVSIKVLEQAKSVASDKGYVNALASLTGLNVTIAPLTAPGTAQAATDTMSSILGASNVPALSSAMATLNSLIPTTTLGALTQGASVEVLSVGSSSAFAVPSSSATPTNPAAPTPSNGTLAVTGGSTQLLGLIGLFLLAGVFGLRWLRRPATTN